MKAQINTTTQLFIVIIVAIAILATSCSSEKQPEDDKGVPAAQASVQVPEIDIHGAVVMGDIKSVRQHLEAGTDIDEKEPTVGSSPLITASVFGKAEIASLLIEKGADVNFQNNEGSTALHTAAFFCYTPIVEDLLSNGADKEIKNVHGSTPYMSVAGPFNEVKPIYDHFNKQLGPMGFKVDYKHLETTRPVIAGMLQ